MNGVVISVVVVVTGGVPLVDCEMVGGTFSVNVAQPVESVVIGEGVAVTLLVRPAVMG